MMDGEVDVVVLAPVERIVAAEGIVSLRNIFLQRMFEIVITQDGKRMSFEVNLPEWLEAFSKFLREKSPTSIELPLVLSGDRFEAQRHDGGVRIRVFDLKSSRSRWLGLTHAQATEFHAKILAELCAAVDRSAGRHVEISDLDRVRLS